MKITKAILESTIQEMAEKILPAYVDENYDISSKEPYELYNALVGTVFDETGYEIVATEAPEYLYAHINGGSKMMADKDASTLDINKDNKVDAEDLDAIDEILGKANAGTITNEELVKGDVTGDFKVNEADKDKIQKEIEKSKVNVEVETYTAEEAAAYNAQLDGAISIEDWKVEPVEAVAAVEGVEGVHYTQEEIDAAQEGDDAYGKTTEDWKVEPVEAVAAVEGVEGVHYTQEEVDAYNAQLDGAVSEGDPKK